MSTSAKVEVNFKGHTFVASREGAEVTITCDGHAVGATGTWGWDEEGGIVAVGT